jgi:hypothetical protein
MMKLIIPILLIVPSLLVKGGPLQQDDDDLALIGGGLDAASRSERQRPLQRAISYTDTLIPLEFQDFAKKKPRKKNLKKSRLLRKMGSDFDARWMSIDPPTAGAEDVVRVSVTENQVAELVEQVSELNLEKELEDMVQGVGNNDVVASEDENVSKNDVRGEMIAVFKQWLVKKSSCPVAFSWQDLGEYFWPRWVVRGECQKGEGLQEGRSETEKTDCSWPQGMKCVPGRAETLHILRWHCTTRRKKTLSRHFAVEGGNNSKKQSSRHKCRWYKVPYPVTTTCRCACK